MPPTQVGIRALQQNLWVCLWGNGGGAHDSLIRGDSGLRLRVHPWQRLPTQHGADESVSVDLFIMNTDTKNAAGCSWKRISRAFIELVQGGRGGVEREGRGSESQGEITDVFTLVFMRWHGRLAREAAVFPLRQITLSPFEKGG